MATATKILRQKQEILDSSPDRFFNSVDKSQSQMLEVAIKEIESLELKDGKIVLSVRNIEAIERINVIIREVLNRGEYVKAVSELLSSMDKTAQLSVDYFRKEFKLPKSDAAANVYRIQRQKAVEILISRSSLDANILTPLKNTLLDAATERMPLEQVIKNVREVISGQPGQYQGRLLRYAKQVASDTMSITDRIINTTIAEELNVQFFHYVGGEIEDTRCFCIKRNDKFFHRKEIEQWGAGKVSDGVKDGSECDTGGGWQGMFRGTNQTNIFNVLGGYNCKHSIVPKSLISVPKEVLARAIQKGYWKPSDKEKKLLSL